MSETQLSLRHHDAVTALTLKAALVEVHADARADLIHLPFYSLDRFSQRLDEHVADPGFELVTGHVDDLLAGYAYGSSLQPDTWFWTHLEGVEDAEMTRETGSRTFWFREILVRRACQQRGFAHQLHDALLSSRAEERAVLFVRVDNPARLVYQRWGWSVVGFLPPQQDSPRFDAMLISLKQPSR